MMSTPQTMNSEVKNSTNNEAPWQIWQMTKKRKFSGTPPTLDIQQHILEPVLQKNCFESLANINNNASSSTNNNIDSQEETIYSSENPKASTNFCIQRYKLC